MIDDNNDDDPLINVSVVRGYNIFYLFFFWLVELGKNKFKKATGVIPIAIFLTHLDFTRPNNFNLHTIIRMPHSVFSPYTSITTNILFFDNTHPTQQTWIYRMDMPEGYKNFSKTKPILLSHFDNVKDWWNNRKEIIIEELPKAKVYTKHEIEKLNYNLDLCGYPHEEEIILDPQILIKEFKEKRSLYNDELNKTLDQILELLNEDN